MRFKRDVARLVLEDRLEELDSVLWRVAGSDRMLRGAEAAPEPPHAKCSSPRLPPAHARTEGLGSALMAVTTNDLKNGMTLVGQGDHIEAWSPSAWEKQAGLLLDFESNSTRFAQLDLTLT